MMTSLFSIFDPSTMMYSHLNWISLLFFLILIPNIFWRTSSQTNILFKVVFKFITNEFKPLMKKSPYILILILSFFVSILMNNVMGLMPYVFTGTSHLTITLSMALPAWFSLFLWSIFNNTENTLVHLMPAGTPYILMPFMVLIETISSLIRPITLALRLMANMVAGHLLIVLISSAYSATYFMPMMILSLAHSMLSLLELAVSFIQAYVFSVLLTLYASDSAQ